MWYKDLTRYARNVLLISEEVKLEYKRMTVKNWTQSLFSLAHVIHTKYK
jgi:hypothetical protein